MSEAIRSVIADAAAYACKFTAHRFWRLLHPVMNWGWR